MGAFTDYAESGLLNHILRSVNFDMPTALKIGLVSTYNATNLEQGIRTEELTGGDYAPADYGVGSLNWISPYASGTAIATHNIKEIKFPQASADIGNVAGVFILDQSNKMLLYGQLTSARNIRNGDQFVFPSGGLRVTLD